MTRFEIELDTQIGRIRAGRLLVTVMLALAGVYLAGNLTGGLLYLATHGWVGDLAALTSGFFQSVFFLTCASLIAPLR